MDTASKRRVDQRPRCPTASVPTGMPLGICAMDNSESSPSVDQAFIGHPSTGMCVIAAATPAKVRRPASGTDQHLNASVRVPTAQYDFQPLGGSVR